MAPPMITRLPLAAAGAASRTEPRIQAVKKNEYFFFMATPK